MHGKDIQATVPRVESVGELFKRFLVRRSVTRSHRR